VLPRSVSVVAWIAASAGIARADLLNHDLMRRHVERVLAQTPDPAQRQRLLAPRASLMAQTLVPALGTWRIERRVFGGLRPAGVVLDWGVGGIAPIALGVAALSSSGDTRHVLAWTALGLYLATRIGIQVIGNLHISAYNRLVRSARDAPVNPPRHSQRR
jgi:hypothetical protein